MQDSFLIGSGAGFSGDRVDAAIPVVEAIAATGRGGAIIFETLGERTLALGQVARHADPARGYEPLLPQFLAPVLAPALQAGITIVGNFGAANPQAAARAVADLAHGHGLSPRIAVISGDDMLGDPAFAESELWEGDVGLPDPESAPIAINVYLGARSIAEAIRAGAQVVVTGRVADPALALGPLVAHFGWDWDDLDRIAAGTMIGHLLECGSQVSGGYFADPGFKDVAGMASLGFPIAEVAADGSAVLGKAPGSGGRIDLATVKEQLLYEIHDPAAYLTPDVTLDVTGVRLAQLGPDRVQVSGARGHPAPARLKATVSYPGEWLGEAGISYAGPNARARAELAIRTIRERLALRGLTPRLRADILGTVSVFDDDGGTLRQRLRGPGDGDFRAHFAFGGDEDTVRAACQEVGALYCCGPAGGGGARIHVSPRFVTRSRMIARDKVRSGFEFLQEARP
ncbi:acyclic terpene utilization AtuA family protein [Cereibacter changlensis]|nr:acyclic terpene utilization AtuA family protein [Cereibacter changlensis]